MPGPNGVPYIRGDARRDRPDRRNVNMIVLLREFLSGVAQHGAAGTVLGEEASRRAWILGQLARDTGPALAPPLDRRRLGVRLLPARRRQRGIVRRLRRSTALGFQLGDPV